MQTVEAGDCVFAQGIGVNVRETVKKYKTEEKQEEQEREQVRVAQAAIISATLDKQGLLS